jgi:hypothetical protein
MFKEIDSVAQLAPRLRQEIERDPLFRLDDIHDLTKGEMRERTMAKFASMVYFVTNEKLDVFTKRYATFYFVSIADSSLTYHVWQYQDGTHWNWYARSPEPRLPEKETDFISPATSFSFPAIADPAFWTRFGVH